MKKDKHHEEIKKLKEELANKDKEISELNDKIRYHQAELINYRKRKEEEVTNRLKYANQDLISELIHYRVWKASAAARRAERKVPMKQRRN